MPVDSRQGRTDALVCTHCGSDIPDRRTRCGRCGSTATVAVPAAAPSLNANGRARLIVLGASALVVSAVTFALTAGSPSSVSSASIFGAGAAASPTKTASEPTPRAARSSDDVPPPEDVTSADHARSGIAAYNGGDIATAEAKLRAAVEADGENAETLNNLGQVLVRAGKAREAIAFFDRAIAVSSGEWAYRFNRARAFAELKDWQQAIAGYTDAARIFPNDYVTQFNLAKAREATGDMSGAVEAYGKAAELAPGQADFQLWYGRALDKSGRQQDAVAAYHRFLELEPDTPQAEKVKARLAQMGESTGAPSRSS